MQDVACVGVQIAWFMRGFKICVASCVGGQFVWVWDLNPNNRIGSGHLRPIHFTTTAKFILFFFFGGGFIFAAYFGPACLPVCHPYGPSPLAALLLVCPCSPGVFLFGQFAGLADFGCRLAAVLWLSVLEPACWCVGWMDVHNHHIC